MSTGIAYRSFGTWSKTNLLVVHCTCNSCANCCRRTRTGQAMRRLHPQCFETPCLHSIMDKMLCLQGEGDCEVPVG